MNEITDIVKPVSYDKNGPKFSMRSVNDYNLKQIKNDNFFEKKAKPMTKDLEKATALVDKATENYDRALCAMGASMDRVEGETKKHSGKLRDTTQKLSDGLARIEKLANFDRLERYVELLERAEKAMSALAELEKSGKLEKIAAAVR